MEKFWSLRLRCLQDKAYEDYFDWTLDSLTHIIKLRQCVSSNTPKAGEYDDNGQLIEERDYNLLNYDRTITEWESNYHGYATQDFLNVDERFRTKFLSKQRRKAICLKALMVWLSSFFIGF
jgi:hypothetical protein